MRWVVGGLAALALLAGSFSWGQAQGQLTTGERLTALEQRVSQLEQRLAQQSPAGAAALPTPACVRRDGGSC